EATQRMASMATDISSKASGQWDKLEGIFEERVSRALNKLGVPSAKDVDALIARIDELSRLVAQLGGTSANAAKATKAAKAPGAAKATAEPTATATTKTTTAKPSTKKAANKPAGKATAKRSQAAA
ncbi:MAG: phasin family protein, partial [Burkholderiaceae bacterium]